MNDWTKRGEYADRAFCWALGALLVVGLLGAGVGLIMWAVTR
jgi:hypothetical protein